MLHSSTSRGGVTEFSVYREQKEPWGGGGGGGGGEGGEAGRGECGPPVFAGPPHGPMKETKLVC